MRDLKFRAWNTRRKVMGDVRGFDWLEQQLLALPQKGNVRLGQWKPIEDYEIEQFTGLLDKNGKPIYEGDILFDEGEYGGKRIVIWDAGMCQFALNNCLGHPLVRGCEKYLEIIGNIHENPELLE
jgi:hypothetical protein